MPRPGPRRPKISLRPSAEDLAWVDARARQLGVNRSEIIRLAIAAARAAHSPEGAPDA